MNVIRFLKEWTLVAAMVAGTVLYLVFAYVPALDPAAMFFEPIFNAILPLFMALILFVVFCNVDFHKLVPVTWHLWICVFQILFVFIITALVLTYKLQGNSLVLAEAILVCIIGPCAAAAPVVTQKIGGDLEQMTTYTFLSNFITALLIPICFPMIEKDVEMSFFVSFLIILEKVCMILVLPMAAAFVVKHCMRHFCHWIINHKDLGYYMWCCSLMVVTGTTVKNICHADTTWWFLGIIAGSGMLLCIVQFAVGRFIGHYFNNTVNAGQALGQKNTAFAIWVAYTFLNPLSSVGPGCYIIWQNLVNSLEIWNYEKQEIINKQ